MELKKADYGSILVIAILMAITAYGFTQLSGEIAIHFDSAGQPDDYMPLVPGLLILPGLAVAILLLFQYLPKIDPLGENYESFEDLYQLLKLLITGILAYVQTMIILWNLGYEYNTTFMVVPVIFSAYYLAAEIMKKAERNWFIGIRTPWTLTSDRVWKETHEKTAPLMKLAAIISLAAFAFPKYSLWFFAAPAFAVAIFATVYSYWSYSRGD